MRKQIFNLKFKIIGFCAMVGFFLILNTFSWQGEDVTILSIDADKVEMTNMSSDRGMVNSYVVENIDLWIPNGMGWYPVSRLGLIVKDDVELAKKVVFYNFGFWPKHLITNGEWTSNRSLMSILGPIGWLRFRLISDDWLWRKEALRIESLGEIMPRDLADNKVLEADVKISVVNASGKNGLGNMMADRLEWWGLMVTSVQTREVSDKCILYLESKSKYKDILENMANILKCEVVNREGAVELVLGTEMEEMIKYSQTYVRSF